MGTELEILINAQDNASGPLEAVGGALGDIGEAAGGADLGALVGDLGSVEGASWDAAGALETVDDNLGAITTSAGDAAGDLADVSDSMGDVDESAGEAESSSGDLMGELRGGKQVIGAFNMVMGVASKVIDEAKDAAERLGRTDVSEGFEKAEQSIQTFTDLLWQMPIAGRDALEWLGAAAEGLGNYLDLMGALRIAVAQKLGFMSDEEAIDQINQLTGATDAATTATEGATRADNAWALRLQGMADLEVANATAAVDALEASTQRFHMAMDPALHGEMTDFGTKQEELSGKADTYRGKIEELNAKQYLTPAQVAELEDAKIKLGEVEQAAADNAAAHEDATLRILFSYAEQALAVDGLTLKELTALTGIATQWGLLDADTATAVDGIIAAANDLENDGSVAGFMNQLNDVADVLLDFPTDINVTYHVNVDGQMPSYTPNGGNGNAFADGGQYTGGPMTVGERGPELLFPNSSGYVMNNNMSDRLVTALEKLAQGGNTYQYYGVSAELAASATAAQAGAF